MKLELSKNGTFVAAMVGAMILGATPGVYFSWSASGDSRTLSCLDVVCRVNTGHHTGSAVVYREDSDAYYLLTARHVIEDSLDKKAPAVNTYFFHAGHASHQIPGTLEWHSTIQDDLAMIRIRKKDFADYPFPRCLSLGPYTVKENERIITVGVPLQRDEITKWPMSMLGFISDASGKTKVSFEPLIQLGHSGGGLISEDGNRLIGICQYREGLSVMESRAILSNRILEVLPAKYR